MTVADALLHLLAIPAAVAGILGVLAALLADGPRGHAAAALAVAAGFVVGCWALDIRPSLPLGPGDDAWRWTVWISLAGALLGALEAGVRMPFAARLALRVVASALAAWLLLRGLVPHAISGADLALRVALFGAAGAALWSVFAALAARRPWVSCLPALGVSLGGTAFLYLELGRSVVLMQATVLLAVSVVSVAGVLLARGRNPFPAALAPVVALTHVGLLAAAHGYLNYGATVRWPVTTTAALALATCAGLLLPRGLREARPWILPALATAGVALVVVAVGALPLFRG